MSGGCGWAGYHSLPGEVSSLARPFFIIFIEKIYVFDLFRGIRWGRDRKTNSWEASKSQGADDVYRRYGITGRYDHPGEG